MPSLNQCESRTPWLAFPDLFRLIIWIQAIVVAITLLRGNDAVVSKLAFDSTLIAQGEVWRVFTHFAISPLASGRQPNVVFLVIFLIFYVSVGSMFGQALEARWGVWRMSVFLYATMITVTIGQLVLAYFNIAGLGHLGGIFLYISVFLLFAVTFPMMKLNLFGILPVPVFIFGLLILAQGVLVMLQIPLSIPFFALCFAPLIVAAVPLLRELNANRAQMAHRAARKSAPPAKAAALHECHICGRTEHTAPDRDFRVAADGEEYCDEHLPPRQS